MFNIYKFIFAIITLIFVFTVKAGGNPSISKVFTPNNIGPGSNSKVTITITNPLPTPVTGLSFTDSLPVAITLSDPANVQTTCDLGLTGTLVAPDGGTTFSLTDARLSGNQSCTVTVSVTASTPGAHTNPAITLISNNGAGISLPVDLTVVTTKPGFSKSFSPSTVSIGGKSTLTFTIDNTANGSSVPNLDFTDNLPSGILIASPANASTTCGTTVLPTVLTANSGSTQVILDSDGGGPFPALAAGAICTVIVDVVTSGSGDLDNVSSDLLANFISAGFATDKLTSTITPLAIIKEFVDDPAPPGGTVTLDFTIINNNRTDSATSVVFTDDLNATLAGLTINSVLLNECGGMNAGGPSFFNYQGGSIPAESSCLIRLLLDVPAGATPGAYTNTTSTVSAIVGGSPVVGNTASDVLYVESVPVLTKEFLESGTLIVDPVVNPGDDVVIRFTLSNTSTTSGATDITFLDELTDGGPGTGFLPFPIVVALPPVPDPPCGAGSSLALISVGTDRQALELTAGSLANSGMAGDSCSFDVTVTIPSSMSSGVYTNTTGPITATVDGDTRIGVPASDDLTILAAPSLTKSFTDDPVAPGATVTLEFTLSHGTEATSDATGISFTDDLAPVLAGLTATGLPLLDVCGLGSSLTGSAGDTLLSFSGGTLAAGESCTFSVSLSVPAVAAPNSYTNTTSGVTATVMGLAATSNPASDDLNIAGLRFSKEFLTNPVIAGETTTLRFTIDNIHPTDGATITFFTDNLQANLTGLAATGAATFDDCGGALSGTTFLTYLGGSVLSGASCTIEVPVLVPLAAADGTYANLTSNLVTSQGNIDPAVDVLEVNSNLIQLDKQFTDDPVAPGDPVTLEFTLTNLDAAQAATMIDFTDDLTLALSGLTFDSVLFNDCGAVVSGTGTTMITVTGASLAAAGTCTIQTGLTVPGAADAGIYTNTTSAVTGIINSLAVTGDAASDDLNVINILTFSKAFNGPTTATGEATLTFTITNPSASISAGNLFFSDNLNAVIPGLIATSLPAMPCGAGSSITGVSLITFTAGNLAPMGTCSFAVDVLVPASATAGSYPNTTSNLFDSGLQVAAPATADLTIEPPPSFAKVFAPDSIGLGQTSTLTFTVDNSASAVAAISLDFTDTLPAGVIVAPSPNASTTCTGGTLTAINGTGSISYTGGSIAASSGCSVSVDVIATANGGLVNTTGDLTSSSGNSGTASDTLTVNPQPGFSKSFAPNPIAIAGVSTLTFTIDNSASTVGVTGISFTDNFPVGLEVAAIPNNMATCTGGMAGVSAGDTSFSYAGGSVLAGTTCTVQVDIIATVSGDLTNTSDDLTSSLGNSGTASDTLRVNPAPLFSKSFSPTQIIVNNPSTLTFTIDNTASTANATALDFTDNLPTNMVVASPSNAGTTCTGGTLNAVVGTGVISYTGGTASNAATCTVSVDVTSADAGVYMNTSGALTSSLGNSGTSSDTLTVVSPPIFNKVFSPSAIAVDGISTLTFTIDNSANSLAATGAAFVDNLPVEVVIALTPNSITDCAAGSITAVPGTNVISFSAGTVTASSSCSLSVDVTSSVIGDHLNVSGDLTSSHGNSGSANATLSVTDLPIFTKVFNTNPDLANNVNTLTFTIDNSAGTIDGTGLIFNDPLPAGLLVATPSNASTTCTGGTLTAADGSANIDYSGGTVSTAASCTISVDVIASLPGDYINVTSLLATDLGNSNSASDTLSIEDAPLFSKAFSPDTIGIGGVSTLTLTLDNTANTIDATAIDFSDNLPADLTLTTPANATTSCTGGTLTAADSSSVVSYSAGTIPAGTSCTISVDVSSSTIGVHTNVTGDLSSSHGNSGTATADLTVANAPVFSKAFAVAQSVINTPVALTFSIDNSANLVAVTALSFNDPLPAGLEVASIPNVVSTCAGGTVTATAGSSTISYSGGSVSASSTCTIAVDIVATTTGAFVNTTSDLSSSLGDSSPAIANLAIGSAPLFTKGFTPSQIVQGGISQLIFTIDNSLVAIDASALDFVDNFPAGLTIATPANASTTCTGGSISAISGTANISYSGGTVPASSSCTVTVDVTASVVGSLTNTSGDLTSSNGNSGTATADLIVELGLSLTKGFATTSIIAGENAEMILTLTNNSSSSANQISFTDDLDAFISGAVGFGLPLNNICGAGSTVTGGSTITISNASLAPNSSCQFSVFITVPETTTAATYVNVTSPVSVDYNGTTVVGAAGSGAAGNIYINGAIQIIPVFNHWVITMLMALILMGLAWFQLYRKTIRIN